MNNKHSFEVSNAALESTKDILPPVFYQEVSDYINKHNEWGLGIETLIDYLCEEESRVTVDQFNKIKEAMECMGLGKSERLKQLSGHVGNT